ncbi:hypothetical protein BGZ46_001689 [Entomortierella lignicola]|nr:hypothetical protein BGZ46_001689 [Entomortierella lignicola]
MLRCTLGNAIVSKQTTTFSLPGIVVRRYTSKTNQYHKQLTGSYSVPEISPSFPLLTHSRSPVPTVRHHATYSTLPDTNSTFSSNYKKISSDFRSRPARTHQNPHPSSSSSSSPSSSDSFKRDTPYRTRRSAGKPIAVTSVPVSYPSKSAHKPTRIHPPMENKQHLPPHSRIGSTSRVTTQTHHGEEDHEVVSESVQILVDAMREAKIKIGRDRPPVFLCSTLDEAEQAMEIFSEYYKTVSDGPGPIGFDTETTTSFVPRKGSGVSMIQIATNDVCLIFQIFRITNNNTSPELFPPRLKAFLEDPEQIKAGVGSSGDAAALLQTYGVHCAGIVNLESMAKERDILARSLAALDAMYGRPGREVVKTKSMLGWNWDKEELDPKWVWYAAKDAFAGAAIYNNIMNNNRKESFMPYEQQYPMTDEEVTNDIYEFLLNSYGGLGRKTTVGMLEKCIIKDYPRFQKVYLPDERVEHAKKYIKALIQQGKMQLSEGKDLSSSLQKHDDVVISGRSLSSMLLTPEGIDILSPYFNGRTVELSTLSTRGITIYDEKLAAVDRDLVDLRLFLELSWVWDQPKKLSSLYGIYSSCDSNAKYRKVLREAIEKEMEEKGITSASEAEKSLDKTSLASFKPDRSHVSSFTRHFVDRMVNLRVMRVRRGFIEINPSIEQECLAKVPLPPPSPVPSRPSKVAKFGRLKGSEAVSEGKEASSDKKAPSENISLSTDSQEIPPSDIEVASSTESSTAPSTADSQEIKPSDSEKIEKTEKDSI